MSTRHYNRLAEALSPERTYYTPNDVQVALMGDILTAILKT